MGIGTCLLKFVTLILRRYTFTNVVCAGITLWALGAATFGAGEWAEKLTFIAAGYWFGQMVDNKKSA